MTTANLLKYVLAGTVSLGFSMNTLAQYKPPPTSILPLEAIDAAAAEALSKPNLDGPQADIDVSQPSVYVPITPCRIANTLGAGGAFGGGGLGNEAGAQTRHFWGWAGVGCESDNCYAPFGGSSVSCGIPSSATAVHVNFTVVDPKGRGYLRVWPYGVPAPTATIFAWNPGYGVTNAANIPICSDATTGNDFINECNDDSLGIVDFWVKIYSEVAENIVIDAFGFYQKID